MLHRWTPLLLVALAGCGRSTPLVPRPAVVRPACALAVEPEALELGDVDPFGSAERQLTLRDEGDGACLVTAPALTAATDAEFSLVAAPSQLLIQPGGAATLTVRFAAGPPSLPMERTGELTATTTDPSLPELHVPLHARLKLCSLAVAPSPLDFGNVILNGALTRTVAVTNTGSAECRVSNLALEAGSSPLFSLPAQPLAFTLAPGAGATVSVAFAARDSAPPHQRTGTLRFDSNDLAGPRREVPLIAYINTICTLAGQYIYAVDNDGMFSRFDPATLSWLDIGVLSCPTASTPFSMNVDQRGVAWVLFDDGQLFRVDTATAACSATSYVPGQAGFQFFGMGSAFDTSTGVDTLYLAGSQQWPATTAWLGSLDLSSLAVTPIGPITWGAPELAGTGDGQLWGFAPAWASATNEPTLARLDPRTGAELEHYRVTTITSGGGFAMKFHSGSFWVFVGADVWKVPRASLVPGTPEPTSPPQRVLTSPGRDIVGAGVSTCAPVQ